MRIKSKVLSFASCLYFLSMLSASPILSQNLDDVKESLFGKTEKKLVQAQAEKANLLSPKLFEQASDKYNEALQDFKNGRPLKDIERKLKEVNVKLDQSLQAAKLGHVTFSTTLKAREDALKANAPEHAKEAFKNAEEEFISATKKLEKGDVKDAKKKVPEINKLYRTAELTAIKVSIMGAVRNLIKEAREEEAHKYTPITYANAQKLLNEAEAILNSNRRSETSAKEKAEAAEVEARHAIFLTKQIKRLEDNPEEWENFILDRETLIEDIARELGFKPKFDEGLDKPLNRIFKITQSLQKEKKQLLAEVDEKNQKLQQLRDELQQYQEKERGLKAELEEKQYKLEIKRQWEEKFKSLEDIFSSEEAVVLRRGNDIILRLIGLTFPSGKSTIEPEYFSLLTAVQRAIRKFPDASITIEGHTDAIGNEQYNQNLSYERALAVKQYLLANMGLDESRVTALGYGESKPIASNETREGRAQNRRIDIVLSIDEELL
ncbi:OmpA family protein [candidate division KSB1 bacterium]|nr:OmpA family protein [candidate division KSB1 bacterium]NIR70069.1 OmpA family protein [candidate division KSB1 bacterium]NIS27507.1 OmpA family protein [candidate division KSB1 bacterium]NIT74356.1 OmpA family protein [candidate division KSB1 bacterium]NIU28225.1 OmpA family protein [candidate division KSB1 bacterium]